MDESIVIVQETEDGLYQEKWVFNWSGRTVTLQRYQKARRGGNAWKVVQMFDHLGDGGYGNWTWLKENQVPWDDDIRAEVALAIVSRFRAGLPSDFKER